MLLNPFLDPALPPALPATLSCERGCLPQSRRAFVALVAHWFLQSCLLKEGVRK